LTRVRAPTTRTLRTSTIRQCLWVRGCVIARSTATIRVPVESRNVSGTAVSDRDPPIRHFFQKAEKNRGMNAN
jgi:hypothetical protein